MQTAVQTPLGFATKAIWAIATALVLGSTVFAAPAPKDQSQDQKAADQGSTSGASSSASLDSNVSTGAEVRNSLTAALPVTTPTATPKRLKFTLYNRLEIGRDAVDNDESTSTSYPWIQVGYALDPAKTLVFRQEFKYSRPKTGEDGLYKVTDPFIGFNNSNLVTFAGDGSVTSLTRLYLPTGEDSRFVKKTQGQLLQWLIVNKPFGKWAFDYHLIGLYMNQTQNSYVDAKGNVKANVDYDVESWVSLTYNINSWIAVFQSAGTDNIWMRPIDGPGVQRQHYAEFETGLNLKPTEKLSLSATLYNYGNIWDSKNAYAPYRDDETIYRFVVSASM